MQQKKKSAKGVRAKVGGKSCRTPASGDTVKISFLVEPEVEARLRALCSVFRLPYPDGIGVILDKTCDIVGKRKR